MLQSMIKWLFMVKKVITNHSHLTTHQGKTHPLVTAPRLSTLAHCVGYA